MLTTGISVKSEEIARLHGLCFGDSPEAVRQFMTLRFRPEDCFVWEEQGRPLAVAHAFPMTLALAKEKRVLGVYVYAVATHPDARGRGLSTRLMEYLWERVVSRGVRAALLVPAEKSLFDFYRKRGYSTVSHVREETRESADCAGGELLPELTPLSPQRYLSLREELLAGKPHVVWDPEQIMFQQAMAGEKGGLYAFRQQKREIGCCAVEVWEGRAYVKELLMPPDRLEAGTEALAARWRGYHPMALRMPAFEEANGSEKEAGWFQRPFAMARTDTPELLEEIQGSYLGLALD